MSRSSGKRAWVWVDGCDNSVMMISEDINYTVNLVRLLCVARNLASVKRTWNLEATVRRLAGNPSNNLCCILQETMYVYVCVTIALSYAMVLITRYTYM